jgi:hypothetical protein
MWPNRNRARILALLSICCLAPVQPDIVFEKGIIARSAAVPIAPFLVLRRTGPELPGLKTEVPRAMGRRHGPFGQYHFRPGQGEGYRVYATEN